MRTCSKCGEDKPQAAFYEYMGNVCRKCHNQRMRDYYAANKDKECYATSYRRYGLTRADVDAMIAKQRGRCLICKAKTKRLYVDHCHKKNRVRGLLCQHCNSGLGFFRDNVKSLRAAIAYLEA